MLCGVTATVMVTQPCLFTLCRAAMVKERLVHQEGSQHTLGVCTHKHMLVAPPPYFSPAQLRPGLFLTSYSAWTHTCMEGSNGHYVTAVASVLHQQQSTQTEGHHGQPRARLQFPDMLDGLHLDNI
jgi:hypothetical protein